MYNPKLGRLYSLQLISSLMSRQSGLLSQTKLSGIHTPVLQLNSSLEQGTGGLGFTNKKSDSHCVKTNQPRDTVWIHSHANTLILNDYRFSIHTNSAFTSSVLSLLIRRTCAQTTCSSCLDILSSTSPHVSAILCAEETTYSVIVYDLPSHAVTVL